MVFVCLILTHNNNCFSCWLVTHPSCDVEAVSIHTTYSVFPQDETCSVELHPFVILGMDFGLNDIHLKISVDPF